MTHDELLAKITLGERFEGASWSVDLDVIFKQLKALRTVVELHKPELMVIQSMCLACTNNLETVIYPCPTIQAIEKELK